MEYCLSLCVCVCEREREREMRGGVIPIQIACCASFSVLFDSDFPLIVRYLVIDRNR